MPEIRMALREAKTAGTHDEDFVEGLEEDARQAAASVNGAAGVQESACGSGQELETAAEVPTVSQVPGLGQSRTARHANTEEREEKERSGAGGDRRPLARRASSGVEREILPGYSHHDQENVQRQEKAPRTLSRNEGGARSAEGSSPVRQPLMVTLMPDNVKIPREEYDAAWTRLMNKVAARSAEEAMLTHIHHRNENLEFSLRSFRIDVEAEVARTRVREPNHLSGQPGNSRDARPSASVSSTISTPSVKSLRTPLSVRRSTQSRAFMSSRKRAVGADSRLFTPLPGERPVERPAGIIPALELDRAMEEYLRSAQLARFRTRRLHAGGRLGPIFG